MDAPSPNFNFFFNLVTTDVITERQIHPKLVTELNRDLTKFGEFQVFE